MHTEIVKYRHGILKAENDTLAVESPLEIQLARHGQRPAKSIAVTMRTPGLDKELAIGFLYTEGIISDPNGIESVSSPEQNVVRLVLKAGSEFNLNQQERHFYTTSSCGVCAKSSIEAIRTNGKFEIKNCSHRIPVSVLTGLLKSLEGDQSLFGLTGGIHASALFDLNGRLIRLCEDVGRHNALDKLIGSSILDRALPLNDHIVFLSGRASFELIQKSFMAAIPVIVALGAPSSMAVELAKENGQTLIGFLKSNTLNIYSGHERIQE